MSNFNRVFVAVLLGVLVQLTASTAMAVPTGGRVRSQNLEYVYNTEYTLSANVGYTIRATATGFTDPVLHVQHRTSGDFLAGNDDYSGRSSSVTIPPAADDRPVWIVVRAYSSAHEGVATFEIDPTVGSTLSWPIVVQAGTLYTQPTTYQAGSHFFTVEEQGGPDNSIILALSGNAATAIAYDDNDGVGFMSWIHTPFACTANCKVLVAARWTSDVGPTTLMWDEDIHYNDSDGDGASNVLEVALTTDPLLVDTDGDGLEDMAETMGVDTPDPFLLRLPFYGANPVRSDLFIQADWLVCPWNPATPNSCGTTGYNPDFYQFSDTNATQLEEFYFSDPDTTLDIFVHIDNGIPNIDPATRTQSGAWGGASQHPSNTASKCEWQDQARVGYFHFARLLTSGGGQATFRHTCLDMSNGRVGGVAAEELGHNLGLLEKASQSGTTAVWCKPNYRSAMNYGVLSETHRFSSGALINSPLNPVEMNETSGLGTIDDTLLEHLDDANGNFRFLTGRTGVDSDGDGVIDYTGQIDWNRDGDFTAGGTVRAAPTWGTLASCAVGTYQADGGAPLVGDAVGVWAGRSGSALAWLPFGSVNRLYWFTRNESTNHIEYRYATSFPENCGTPPAVDCKTNWFPELSEEPTVLTDTVAGGAPAVARYWDTSNLVYKLVLIYPDTTDRLRSRIFTPIGHGYWTAAVYLPGAITVQGDVAAATYGGRAYVYASAATNNTLYKWSLSSTATWTGPTTQLWSTGGSVLALHGIGVTSGQYWSGGIRLTRMFAAIPVAAPAGKLMFAWNDAFSSNTWTAFPDTDWGIGLQYAKAQPGLAYAPFDPEDVWGPGRFYLAWTPPDAPGPRPMLMAMTEGNEQVAGNAPRQLRWDPVLTHLEQQWSMGIANNTLHYDLTFDRNVRAVFTKEYGTGGSAYRALTFEPFADGIFPNIIGDQDDYVILRANLDACFAGHHPFL